MKAYHKLSFYKLPPSNVFHIKGGNETTVNKAKMADKVFNAMKQYISS
ncbi:hypothetical protein ACJD0Z_15670 [Flavobacteriaceae bacterium M23B6Z8]